MNGTGPPPITRLELHHLEIEIERFYPVMHVTDDLVGLRNGAQAAIIVATAAWTNKKSVAVSKQLICSVYPGPMV
jgi:hypothetical protein